MAAAARMQRLRASTHLQNARRCPLSLLCALAVGVGASCVTSGNLGHNRVYNHHAWAATAAALMRQQRLPARNRAHSDTEARAASAKLTTAHHLVHVQEGSEPRSDSRQGSRRF
jgi:hypothetical protein